MEGMEMPGEDAGVSDIPPCEPGSTLMLPITPSYLVLRRCSKRRALSSALGSELENAAGTSELVGEIRMT